MKQLIKFVTFICLIGTLSPIQAQINAQQLLINAYYGGYDVYRYQHLNFSILPNATNVKTVTLGHVGGAMEYMVTKRFGIGFEINHIRTTLSYDAGGYHYELRVPRTNVFIKTTYHFLQNKRFDPYVTIGVGYAGSINRWITNQPDFDPETAPFTRVPISGIRIAVGFNYFIAPALGLKVEAGVGSAIISGGIVGRLDFNKFKKEDDSKFE